MRSIGHDGHGGSGWRSARRPRRAAPALSVALAVLAAALAGVPAGIAAQAAPSDVREAEARYNALVARYEAAVALLDEIKLEFSRRFDQTQLARGTDRWAAAASSFYEKSLEVDDQTRRARQLQDSAVAARRMYRGVLQDRRNRIVAELATARPESARQALRARLDDINFRILEVDEASAGFAAPFSIYPVVQRDRTDTPDDVRAKLGLVEIQIETADTLIAEFQRDIGRLQEAQAEDRGQRARADFLSDLGRFDNRPPTGASQGGAEGRPTIPAVQAEGLTLEQRIQDLQTNITTLRGWRDQLVARQAEFIDYLRGGA